METILSHKAVQHLLESSCSEFLRHTEVKALCEGHEQMRMLLLDVLENLENQKEIIKSMVKDIKAMIPEVQDTTKIRMDGGGTE